MQDFQQLQVWQKAHALALDVYRASQHFPNEERFGLTNQLRRSAGSVGANIAEGCGRGSDQDFRKFLHIAMGSASETENHLLLCRGLEFLPEEKHRRLLDQVREIKRMLATLIKRVSADS